MNYIPLNKCAKFYQGKQVPIGEQSLEKSNDRTRFIRIVDFTSNDELPRYINSTPGSFNVLPDDLIMIRYGSQTAGKVVRGFAGIIANNMFKIELDYRIFDKDYVFYYLSSKPIRELLVSMQSSSTMPAITFGMLENIKIPDHSLENQKKIAAVLSALDSKIELNTKLNNNLEQQFNELYKQYFSSEQSERWDSVPLSEMIFFQEGPGIRNWQYVAENGTKFINIRCINDGDINTATANMISNEEATGKYKHFMLEENDIVMSCSGTLGRYAIVRKEHLPLCLNTSVIRFRSIEQAEDFTYIYGYLTSPEFLNKQAEMACGSVQSNFGPTHLKKITMKKPPKELRLAFHERTCPLLNAIIHNRRESAHLAIVRDALLPKLMSGEIDVSKVDISDPSYLDKLLFSEETE